MVKEIRSTIYLREDLYELFREACNIKFGDKQGKIKKGIIMAVNNFVNETLGVQAKAETEQAKAEKPVEAETPEPENIAEEELVDLHIDMKTPQDVVEEPEVKPNLPQEPMVSRAEPPLVLAKPSLSAKDVAKEIIEESIAEGDKSVEEEPQDVVEPVVEPEQVEPETLQEPVEEKVEGIPYPQHRLKEEAEASVALDHGELQTISDLDQVPKESTPEAQDEKPRPKPVVIKEDMVSVLAKKLAEERRKRGM